MSLLGLNGSSDVSVRLLRHIGLLIEGVAFNIRSFHLKAFLSNAHLRDSRFQYHLGGIVLRL